MANLVIKPTTNNSLKIQDQGGTERISLNTSGELSLPTVTSGTLGSGVIFPAGMVLRVFHKTSTADITVSSGTTIVTGCTQTLTPLSNTSKFLISYSYSGRFNSGTDTTFQIKIYYGGSAIGGLSNLNNFSSGNTNMPVAGAGSFLHSPSTASEITYDIRCALTFGSGSLTVTGEGSQMTIMEVAG